jgi:glycerate 2-kinase
MPTAPEESAAADRERAREMRAIARRIFHEALAESSVERAFAQNVEYHRGVLRVGGDLFGLPAYDRVSVISIGKAANAMVDALCAQLGESMSGIVAATTAPQTLQKKFRYFLGGHPLPNEDSLRAGRAVLRLLGDQPESSLVIFLLSGGGSAAAEVPTREEITLQDLAATYQALVLSGAPIAEINAIRKHLSALKGGRLAQAAAPAQQVSILVSDVPEQALDALASGPTMPDPTTVEDCYAIAARHGLVAQFPASVRALFQQKALEETPKAGDPAFVRSRWWTVLSNATVQRVAAARATAAGFAVEMDNACDDWDYRRAADHLLHRLRELRRGVSRVCLISGGEVTVKVSPGGGVGGRNQQFALYCAQKIGGENIAVLSAGTDGVDGNSPAAGAVVDATTLPRAQEMGLDPAAALERFDAYPFFARLGDAITAPLGNNLRDLRLLIAC